MVLPNHFASKGSDYSGTRRRAQAEAVRSIYRSLRRKHAHVLVAGDLNDHPEGGSLDALLRETDLVDAMSLPQYDGYPGTYERATAKQKIDYLLLSPALRKMARAVDVFRKGYYAPTKWESYADINRETKDRYQASDHHCVWVDVELG